MREIDTSKVPSGAIFTIEIMASGRHVAKAEGIGTAAAAAVVAEALDKLEAGNLPFDQEAYAALLNCAKPASFGFSGHSAGNRFKIAISARAERIKGEKAHKCPRRGEVGEAMLEARGMPEFDSWDLVGGDRVCSYCGSLHPEDLLKLAQEKGLSVIEASTKGYKWYLNRPEIPNAGFGAIKYYRMHDTEELLEGLRALDAKAKGEGAEAAHP